MNVSNLFYEKQNQERNEQKVEMTNLASEELNNIGP